MLSESCCSSKDKLDDDDDRELNIKNSIENFNWFPFFREKQNFLFLETFFGNFSEILEKKFPVYPAEKN